MNVDGIKVGQRTVLLLASLAVLLFDETLLRYLQDRPSRKEHAALTDPQFVQAVRAALAKRGETLTDMCRMSLTTWLVRVYPTRNNESELVEAPLRIALSPEQAERLDDPAVMAAVDLIVDCLSHRV